MGRKGKKPPKGAFSFFLEEYVEKEREMGRQVSHRIAAEECGSLWEDLTEERKQKYRQLATSHKALAKVDEHKFTSTGITFAQLEKKQEELKMKIEKADTEIKMTISNLDTELLKTHLFYLIHCNYYCKTDEGFYVPGELAIVEFNLRDGVKRTYHTLINPGPIPLGYAFEAKKTIEEVHGLPYPPYDEGDCDYFGILDKVLIFLEPGRLPDGRYPPLYCMENNIKASENILQTLSETKCEGGNYFRVFLLHKMFFWLKNKCIEFLDEENVGFPVMYNAESEISKDLFCYSPGISCCFHMMSEDKFQNCSLSVVQRQVYTICDHCCQYVEVKLVPGKHCRLKGDTERSGEGACFPRADNPHRNRSRPSETELDGRSTCAGEFGWGKEPGGSFLHEEMAEFGSFETSSFASRFSRAFSPASVNAPSSVFSGAGLRADEEGDDEDFKPVLPLGRGAGRR